MKMIGSYGVFTILKPINHTTSQFGIVIQGDDTTKIAKGEVVSGGSPDGDDDSLLSQGDIVFYLRSGAHQLPGSDLVAVHDDNIVGFEYEDEE